jgi:hypothetical protein
VSTFDLLERIRDFPEGVSAEDTMRQLLGEESPYVRKSVESALDALFETIENDPEIEASWNAPWTGKGEVLLARC